MKYRREQRKDDCCFNCNECGHFSRDCLLPKRTRKEQRLQVFEKDVERIFWEVMTKNNWKPEDFAAEEIKEERSVSSSINVVHSENVKPVFEEDVESIFWEVMKENNCKLEDFAAEETKEA